MIVLIRENIYPEKEWKEYIRTYKYVAGKLRPVSLAYHPSRQALVQELQSS